MVEVKSATEVKDYHRDDVAIQAFVARQAGLNLESIAVAYVDTDFTYPGGEDYRGLFREEDLTAETAAREADVRRWIAAAQATVDLSEEPNRETGKHCWYPFECGFTAYCKSQEPPVEFPVAWIPRIQKKALKAHIDDHDVRSMEQLPDSLLNDQQRRVKQCSVSGTSFFDAEGAAAALAPHGFPAFFLDFETISFAVPIWPGTHPYQSFPFQFSVHRVSEAGDLAHREYLDRSGNDPREAIARALITACESTGPVFAYSSYEKTQIKELKRYLPKLSKGLVAILARLVDLRPIAEEFYYHPRQQGSWTIKQVLPATTGRDYDELIGIKDGSMAMAAYLEAIEPATSPARKVEIDAQLRAYCALDTKAMVDIWKVFTGRK